MLTRREWITFVIAPFFLCLVIDQLTKSTFGDLGREIRLGPLHLIPFKNFGFMMGTFADLSKIYTIVFPATLGGFVTFLFLAAQYFLPIKSSMLRSGVSIFAGSVLSNIFDRIRLGYVVDFLYIDFGVTETGIFNVADALQWIGVAMISIGYAAAGSLLYPPDQRRNQIWIDPNFQTRYCAALVVVGFCFSLTLGFLSYTFLTVTLSQVAANNLDLTNKVLDTFKYLYFLTSFLFLLCIWSVGVWLSHRIVGPVKGFEIFLEDLLQGKLRQFKVRKMDEFVQLEQIAAKYTEFFNERLGVVPEPLKAGLIAPQFQGETAQSDIFNLKDHLGKKLWVIFYRYATCPICALQLENNGELIFRAKEKDVAVVIVFESRKDQFDKPECGKTSALLANSGAILISDPERKIYRQFRTRVDILRLIRPITILRLVQARLKGYIQGSIDGVLGQMPCDVLISKTGEIHQIYYGRDVDDRMPRSEIEHFLEAQ